MRDFPASETNACAFYASYKEAVNEVRRCRCRRRRRHCRIAVPSRRCASSTEQPLPLPPALQPLAFTRDRNLLVNRGTAILIRHHHHHHHHRRRRRRRRRHRNTTLPSAPLGASWRVIRRVFLSWLPSPFTSPPPLSRRRRACVRACVCVVCRRDREVPGFSLETFSVFSGVFFPSTPSATTTPDDGACTWCVRHGTCVYDERHSWRGAFRAASCLRIVFVARRHHSGSPPPCLPLPPAAISPFLGPMVATRWVYLAHVFQCSRCAPPLPPPLSSSSSSDDDDGDPLRPGQR